MNKGLHHSFSKRASATLSTVTCPWVRIHTYQRLAAEQKREIPVLSAGKKSMHNSSYVCDPLGQAPPVAVSARGTDLSEHAQKSMRQSTELTTGTAGQAMIVLSIR